MSTPKDGGAAFPLEWSTFEQRGHPAYEGKTRLYHHQNGMSLRDYFAGQALAGLTGNQEFLRNLQASLGPGESTAGVAAQSAYEFADAMLAEREKAK